MYNVPRPSDVPELGCRIFWDLPTSQKGLFRLTLRNQSTIPPDLPNHPPYPITYTTQTSQLYLYTMHLILRLFI